jgi:hypothetical protein
MGYQGVLAEAFVADRPNRRLTGEAEDCDMFVIQELD